jgi:F-type H+-transporting ATPase subunit epsilon
MMADSSAPGTIRCVIVTPETTSLDTRCRSVTLPLFDGSRGIGRGHAPFIGRLRAGEIRVSGEQGGAGDGVRSIFVEGGFVEVAHDGITVITQQAIPAERIDQATARSEYDKVAGTRAVGDEAIDAKFRRQEAARALVRASERTRR